MKELGMARSAFAASAVAVALALAGCGGGGDSDDRADRADAVVDGLKEQIATLEGQVETLTGERNTAQGEVSDLKTMIGMMDDPANDAPSASLYAQLNAAKDDAAGLRAGIGMMDDLANAAGSLYAQINYHMGEVSRLETAAGNAGEMPSETGSLHAQIAYHMEQASNLRTMIGDPTDAAGGTSLHAQLNAANDRANGFSDMIGDASEEASTAEGASLHAQLNHYKAEAERLQDELDKVDDQNLVAKAKAVNAAIRLAAGSAPGVNSVKAAADGTLEVKVTGYDDAGAAPNSADLPDGWRGSMLTDSGNTLVVYTDINDADAVTFQSRYSSMSDPGTGTTYLVDRTGGGRSIAWTEVTRPDTIVSTSTTTADGTTTTTTSFKGSVLGAAGTFLCTAGTCTPPQRSSNGTVNATGASANNWSFAPEDGVLAEVPDTAYINLGWWLGKGDAADTYSFATFVNGVGDLATDDYVNSTSDTTGDDVSGSASYSGAATGKFSFLDTLLNQASAGHWVAAAKLNANFDVDSDGNADDNDGSADPLTGDGEGVMVSGSITDFYTDEGKQTWSVTLSRATDSDGTTDGVQTQTDFTTIDGSGTVWSLGPDAAAKGAGTWNANFVGDSGTGNNLQPSAIIGSFNAEIGARAYITGVYGAQKDEDE